MGTNNLPPLPQMDMDVVRTLIESQQAGLQYMQHLRREEFVNLANQLVDHTTPPPQSTRTKRIRQVGAVFTNKMCPFGCYHTAQKVQTVMSHVEKTHLQGGREQIPPDEWLRACGRWVCMSCKKLMLDRNIECKSCGRERSGMRELLAEDDDTYDVQPRLYTILSPFELIEPTWQPSIKDILQADITVMKHIPREHALPSPSVWSTQLTFGTIPPAGEAYEPCWPYPKSSSDNLSVGGDAIGKTQSKTCQ